MILNFIITVFLYFSVLFSNSELNGRIYDDMTGEPLVGVKVTINEYYETYTDFEGYFKYIGLSDSLDLNIDYISYEILNLKIKNGENNIFYLDIKSIN